MNRILLFVFSITLSFSALAELEDAKVIRSVWDMKSQSCNGSLANNMSRNKNEDKIRESKNIVLETLGYSFKVPQLPKVEETIVKLNINDRSRGVIDNYLLLSDQDLEPPFAAIVITELPPNMRSREEAFTAVRMLQNQLAQQSGFTVVLNKIDGPHGNSLEMVTKNRVGSFCFPTSTFKFIPSGYDISTMGVSRFSFIGGKLVEFSVIVTLSEGIDDKESISYAREIMDDFWKRLKII